MYFLQISRRVPESCPAVNQGTREPTVALLQRNEALMAKHGVKMAGMWNDHPAHVLYNIYDAPSVQAFMAYQTEPECQAWLSFNTVETRIVMGAEEIKSMLHMK